MPETATKAPAQQENLLTFKEAMAYLRVSRSTLLRFMRDKKLEGHKVGARWKFYRDDLKGCVK